MKNLHLSYPKCTHTCHKLWTKICEIRQNVKGDLTKFCEIFLKITLDLPQYSLKSLFFMQEDCEKHNSVRFVYFFIKSVLKWSENSVRFVFFMGIAFQMGQILWDFISHVRYGMYMHPMKILLRLHKCVG